MGQIEIVTRVFGRQSTGELLPFRLLIDAIARAGSELEAGKIVSPVRLGVPLPGDGVLLSMPASAADIAVHKLVSMCPANAAKGMPTIFGQVTVCNSETGEPEMILDGPTVTGRRTAAVSMLAIENLKIGSPRCVLVIGTGTQATYHIQAISEIFPNAEILVQGGIAGRAVEFSEQLASAGLRTKAIVGEIPDRVDTVITLTTSKVPVYWEAARNERLLIGVGSFRPDAAEFAPEVVLASAVFVDDLHGASEESGDLLQAGVDWSTVRTLASVVGKSANGDRPIFFKSVGSGAWDLAAGRVARDILARG